MQRKPSGDQDSVLILNLLQAVAVKEVKSQRHLAAELGIALGLVNVYLKRCASKGLVKISQVPARRYSYYLTPKGFAEKSRLTARYLSHSFEFFREARSNCASEFQAMEAAGHSRIVLAGWSDLAQIALLCALERDLTVVAVVDERASLAEFAGTPVVNAFSDISAHSYAVLVTDCTQSAATYRLACRAVSGQRVFAPDLLNLKPRMV